MDAAAGDDPRRLGLRALHDLIVLGDAGHTTGYGSEKANAGRSVIRRWGATAPRGVTMPAEITRQIIGDCEEHLAELAALLPAGAPAAP